MDFSEMLIAEHIQFYTDASGHIGFGGICGQSWMSQKWPDGFIQNCNLSIGYLKLYALVAGVLNWIQRFRNQRVILVCDNLSTVSMVNTMSSSCKNCMVLIRILVLQCLIYNVRVFARHLRSMENFYADALSRDQMDAFWTKASQEQRYFEPLATQVPEQIWPIDNIWLC